MARKTLQLEQTPPRRLVPGARWRSFKRGPDRIVWETATEELRVLLASGWRVTSIDVDWGKTKPFLASDIMHPWIRSMCSAPDAAKVKETQASNGRGSTLIRLVR